LILIIPNNLANVYIKTIILLIINKQKLTAHLLDLFLAAPPANYVAAWSLNLSGVDRGSDVFVKQAEI
jgi:hypothetical protein